MPTPPPIIIKKKISHGGHHGGAWKVAYADFVTAMMALFIVLWLMNSSSKIQKAVGGYFKDPTGTSKMVGTDMQGSGENFLVNKDNMKDLMDQLQRTMREVPDFEKLQNHIDMTVTNEGLRIELTESATGMFFNSGSTTISEDGNEIVKVLAHELGKMPNHIAIEGHTDSQPYHPGATYTNWELSSDRANAARRLMQANGIREDQITQVRGFADQKLRKPDAPQDPSNRRISFIVEYLKKEVQNDPEPAAGEKKPEEGAEHPVEKAGKHGSEGAAPPAKAAETEKKEPPK
jgi:chemotaxis protein MotB